MYISQTTLTTQQEAGCRLDGDNGCLGATYAGGGSLLLLVAVILCVMLLATVGYKFLKRRK